MKLKSITIIFITVITLLLIFLSTTQLALIPVTNDTDGKFTTPVIIPDQPTTDFTLYERIIDNLNTILDWLKALYIELLNYISSPAIIDDVDGDAFSDGVRTGGDEY